MTCGSIGGISQPVNPQKWGFLPRTRCGQPYGWGGDVTAAGSAVVASAVSAVSAVPTVSASTVGCLSAGGSAGGPGSTLEPSGGSGASGAGAGAGDPVDSDSLDAPVSSSVGRPGGVPPVSERLGVGVSSRASGVFVFGALSGLSATLPVPWLLEVERELGCFVASSSWPEPDVPLFDSASLGLPS